MWRSASREGRGWRSAQTTDARSESVMQHKCKMQCTGNAMQNDVDEQWRPEGREFEGEDYNKVHRNGEAATEADECKCEGAICTIEVQHEWKS